MKPILILYATHEGHTRRIAERVAAALTSRGQSSIIRDLRAIHGDIDFSAYRGLFLAGPIHAGKHPRKLVRFMKAKRQQLAQIPTALLTVCLAQAGIENPKTPADKRADAERAVQALIDELVKTTQFHPTRVKVVAGALPYTKYNPFVRWMMRRIVAKEGGDTDTSRDYEYTNWAELDRFVVEFVARDCERARNAGIEGARVDMMRSRHGSGSDPADSARR